MDGSGTIDFDEAQDLVRDTMKELGINMELGREDFVQFFEFLDRDGNKCLSQKEIAIFLLSLQRREALHDEQIEQVCNYLGYGEDGEGGDRDVEGG